MRSSPDPLCAFRANAALAIETFAPLSDIEFGLNAVAKQLGNGVEGGDSIFSFFQTVGVLMGSAGTYYERPVQPPG